MTTVITLPSVTDVVPTDDYSNNNPLSNWCGTNR